MGDQPRIVALEGRSYLTYGEAFLQFYPAIRERLWIVSFDEQGLATGSYLFGIGREHDVQYDTELISSYIEKFIPFAFGMAHNHPNGGLPSAQDEKANQFLSKLARHHKKKFLNHVVVGKRLYYMKEIQPDVFDELERRVDV